VEKYPAPTQAGIGAAAQLSANDFTIDATTTTDTYAVQAKSNAACTFTYKMATDDAAPTITDTALTATNCN
jgi:hypothetical protein